MLETLFIILVIISIILLLITLAEDNEYWTIVGATICCVLFMVLALGCVQLERPYEIFNSTSGAIETGIHSYTNEVTIYTSYVFLIFFGATLFYFIVKVFDIAYSKKRFKY